jgi:XRE family transcriptional regulator, fatty acid utilization regulator
VQEGGTISKAYENDGLHFPTDALGSIEGQPACRRWAARRVLTGTDRFSPHYQYTDTPWGTYWCTARPQAGEEGDSSVSIGVPYAHVKWFRGRETTEREQSRCPDKLCCRRPPADLDQRWAANSRPSAKAHTSILAALPRGAFPGVDTTEVYSFLERNAPTNPG